MTSFAGNMRRYVQYTFYLLALLVLGWGFTPYESFFLGFILGSVLSLLILWSLFSRVKRLGQAVEEGKKMYSLGTLTRFALAVLGVIIATRYPEVIQLYGVVIGLMSTYFIIFLDFIIQKIRLKQEER
ncbi:ATP synthase subunit [Alkalihalophilus pseudofirmus]|uniref:ATP synthase subunit I n=1 Tax=Alkalihalobacterium alkalinitrilicum TaxID=427920 RepID=UPI00094D9659|nr:ATP synthase subunit I [Alkalihalobacterium alkalinitrilicum]OLO42277.1 ATP synthase subunit [Alkalihalophilus pseudofirmus]